MAKQLIVLNGLAAILAVLHHSTHWVLTAMIWWADRYSSAAVPNMAAVGSPGFLLLRVVDQFAAVAVFVFLFVAGYAVCMTAGAGQHKLDWKVVLARIKHLVPPYLIWSVVMLAIAMLQGETHRPMELVRILAMGGAAAPYYFVPLIVQLYILSPWLLKLARTRWKPLLVVAVALQLGASALVYWLLLGVGDGGLERAARWIADWHVPAYASWFILGLIAGSHRLEFAAFLARIRRFLPWVAVATLAAGILEWDGLRRATGRTWLSPQETIADLLFFYILLLTLLAFNVVPPSATPALTRVGAKALGIYMSHVLVLEVVARATYHFAPWLLAYPILFQLALVLSGVGIPLLAMGALKKSAPGRFYAWAFG